MRADARRHRHHQRARAAKRWPSRRSTRGSGWSAASRSWARPASSGRTRPPRSRPASSRAIDVAHERGYRTLVVTTGGKSEAYAMKLHPEIAEEAFIQMGDFVGATLKHCARRQIERVLIVGMIGKLSKMADGKMQTHAAGSEVNMELLAGLAAELGAQARGAGRDPRRPTPRATCWSCARARGWSASRSLICRRVVEHAQRHAGRPAARRGRAGRLRRRLAGPVSARRPRPGRRRRTIMNDMRQMTALGRKHRGRQLRDHRRGGGRARVRRARVAGGAAGDPRHRRLRVQEPDALPSRSHRRGHPRAARRLPGHRRRQDDLRRAERRAAARLRLPHRLATSRTTT